MASQAIEYRRAIHPQTLAGGTSGGLFSGIRNRWRREMARRKTITELSRLSDDQLRDIGLSREMISEAVDQVMRRNLIHVF